MRVHRPELSADGSTVTADILGETISYRLNIPGRHIVNNTAAVLAAVKLAGADLAAAARALAGSCPQPGRGARTVNSTRSGRGRHHR